jgi:hypothetical protein
MSKGVDFDFRPRGQYRRGERPLFVRPPFNQSGQIIYGTYSEPGFSPPVVAFMHDFYAVSADEQRQMVESTLLLCEMMYHQQLENQP